MSSVLKFKDGDEDGTAAHLNEITISCVDNGFIVHIMDSEGEEIREVYLHRQALINALDAHLGGN